MGLRLVIPHTLAVRKFDVSFGDLGPYGSNMPTVLGPPPLKLAASSDGVCPSFYHPEPPVRVGGVRSELQSVTLDPLDPVHRFK